MKTHLPKALFVALMAAVAALQVQAQETEQPVSAKDYNVGLHDNSKQENFPSASQNFYAPELTDGKLTLSGNDRMGYIDNNGNLITSLTKTEWDASLSFSGVKYTQKSSGNVTKNVYIDGTLVIEDNAQVVLGGQYKSKIVEIANPIWDSKFTTEDEYTGLIAKEVQMSGGLLQSFNANVEKMTVSGGTVNIHTDNNYKSGNGFFVVDSPEDSKQVRIKNALTVSGDAVVNIGFGDSGADNKDTADHQQVAFGDLTYTGATYLNGTLISVQSADTHASQITQTGGTLNVGGKSTSVKGLNINQTGGTMSISANNYHFLADYGDSVITQGGDDTTSMTLGCIKAFNSYYRVLKKELENLNLNVPLDPTITLIQNGQGTISMSGVDFTAEIGSSSAKSSITQQGGGLINLNGDYKGATFDVTQKEQGGTIVLTGNMTADKVDQQSSTSTLEVNSGASLSANTVEAQGSIKNDGTLTANKLTVANAPKTRAEGDAPAVENNGTMNVTDVDVQSGTFVNNGTLNGTVTVNGGLFINYGPAIMLLAEGDNTAQSTTQIIVNDGEARQFGTTKDSITVNGGTLTLGDNSSVADITLNSGSITLEGNATATALTLNGGVVNLGDNFTIDLNGGNVILGENVTFTVNVESLEDTTQSFTLFENIGNAADLETSFNVVFKDANNGTQAGKIVITDGKVTATAVIPEPTTATLSLLALAGLAMRRRRK